YYVVFDFPGLAGSVFLLAIDCFLDSEWAAGLSGMEILERIPEISGIAYLFCHHCSGCRFIRQHCKLAAGIATTAFLHATLGYRVNSSKKAFLKWNAFLSLFF